MDPLGSVRVLGVGGANLDPLEIVRVGMGRYLFEFWVCLVSSYMYELRFSQIS